MLSACGLMHGLAAEEAKQRAGDLLDLLDLTSASREYLCLYSQGMKQKMALACALIHTPEILLMDEPFLGLDPTAIYRLDCLFRQLAAKGRTLILSSHNMALVERLCSRAGILFKGVLQQEFAIASPGGGAAQRSSKAKPMSPLEAVLWEVVGEPELKKPDWM